VPCVGAHWRIGPGFRDNDLPHIFEPFFTRLRGGTEVWLVFVQRIVSITTRIVALNTSQGRRRPSRRLAWPAARAPGPLDHAYAQA